MRVPAQLYLLPLAAPECEVPATGELPGATDLQDNVVGKTSTWLREAELTEAEQVVEQGWD